ncbi:Serine/threonine-protein kinase AFC3 [Glycine max]|nr:Serine/threonine-protein kinase AFC3 [Glycine max]
MPMQDFLLFWAKAHTAPNAVVSPWHAQIAAQTNICAVTDSSMVSVEKIHIERERTRKRPRLAWDVAPPSASEAQRALPVPGDEGFERKHVSPPKRDDDREGHYVFNLGENLTPRYKILGKMGEGTFGRVLECWDRQTREYVAIKVVRSIRKYRDAAMLEIDVLQQLAKNDRGSSRSEIDMHELRLIHTDLKPENILLVSSEYVKLPSYKRISSDEMQFRCLPKSSAIKLIDFGSTAYDNQNHSSIVSTRHYRAPEIILGLGWSYPCDLWSVGCILIELCSGEALFQTHENLEHLAMMERVLGPIPEHMICRSNKGAEKYFKRGSRLRWPEGAVSRESISAVKKLGHLKDIVSRNVDSSRSSLTELLHGLLTYDPTKRITARQALDHPFFRNPT